MKLRGNIEFQLHEDEAFSNAIRRDGDFFEAEILDYLAKNHPTHHIILDVGANIGNHTVYFASFLEYEYIYAFEPIFDNWKLLAYNASFFRNVFPIQAAVSDQKGYLQMSINRGNMGASQVDRNGEERVQSTKLDCMTFAEDLPVTLLKIDTEWHEPAVIDGAHELITKWHPLILIEDTNNEYEPLLTWFGKGHYEQEKAWPEHNTYLYRWIE